jgi:putative heme iron utilization protein
MDPEALQQLARLIRGQRVAALGTLRQGAPFVSMVPYAPAADFSAFYVHLSRLAYHTQDILKDARVSLMIAAADDGKGDPQTLARLSIRGVAEEITRSHSAYAELKALYLARFPQAKVSFGLGDFSIFSIQPKSGRFVAGFGRIFNLGRETLQQAAGDW